MKVASEYLIEFEATLVASLGGVEMAAEFFAYHPDFERAMRASAMMHFAKGGSAEKGAEIFFTRYVRPQLRKDRDNAQALNGLDDLENNGRR